MIPLHNHSQYSLLDGLSTTKDIANRVGDLGFSACACTDHDLVAGHIDFFKTLTDADIKPILGIETYQAVTTRTEHASGLNEKRSKDNPNPWRQDNFHLILLAKNNTGLKNLWRINTESHRTGFYYNGRLDWELLEQYHEGLICTSACISGMLQQAILGNPHLPDPLTIVSRFKEIFGDDYYIELNTWDDPKQMVANPASVQLALETGTGVVYANDAHYAFPEQHDLHDVIMSLKNMESYKDSYIMTEDEVRAKLDYLPTSAIDESIANSELIADRCSVSLPEQRRHVPVFIPDSKWATDWDMLFDLTMDGFVRKVRKYGKDEGEYLERLRKELRVIKEADLTSYFLIVRDYVYWAKQNVGLVGPGRGSVGGSLVAYLLGITEVDPIRYGLIFERFYNQGRETSLPDIDIDFSKTGREKVKKYISQKYGEEYVAELSNVGRMHAKMGINDVGRALMIPMMETQKISKILDQTIDAGLQSDWDEIYELVGEELQPFKEKYWPLFEYAEELYDHVRTYGIHASGVLISDEPLADTFPLKWVPKHKKMVTQWDMDVAADNLYMKMDLLGLRTLDTLEEVNKLLKEQGKEEIEWDKLQYQEFPDEMWGILDQGLTVGLFQIEDGGLARQIAKEMKPRSVEDLGVIVALNRPGPLRSGAMETYLKKRGADISQIYVKKQEGLTKDWDDSIGDTYGAPGIDMAVAEASHPLVYRSTQETFGVFVFQEQVIEFFVNLGYSLTEADDIRAIMGKKKVEKLQEEYPRYLERATQHMDQETADSIWRDLLGFSKYAFNKSHAVEYGIILLWCLYAKWKHPKEFVLAGMRTADKPDRKVRFVQEAQRMKIEVYGPDINQSQLRTSLAGDGIRYGLADVKGVGATNGNWIIENRPFNSYEQFEDYVLTNKKVLPSGIMKIAIPSNIRTKLVEAGAFDSTNPRDIDENTRMAFEEEYLGVALSDKSATILEEYSDQLSQYCVPIDSMIHNGDYTIAGVIQEWRDSQTKQGKRMRFMKIANDTESIEVAVWSEKIDALDFIFQNRTAGVFQVRKGDRGVSLLNAHALTSRGKDN
jgi:DNA polymerase-3 subunit alpha